MAESTGATTFLRENPTDVNAINIALAAIEGRESLLRLLPSGAIPATLPSSNDVYGINLTPAHYAVLYFTETQLDVRQKAKDTIRLLSDFGCNLQLAAQIKSYTLAESRSSALVTPYQLAESRKKPFIAVAISEVLAENAITAATTTPPSRAVVAAVSRETLPETGDAKGTPRR